MCGRKDLNDGERNCSMNQNLTVCDVEHALVQVPGSDGEDIDVGLHAAAGGLG
jgi:hypothetical protein